MAVSPAPRPPYGRRRAIVGLGAVGLVLAVVAVATSGGNAHQLARRGPVPPSHAGRRVITSGRSGKAKPPVKAAPAGLPAAEAGLLPWQLAAPISREAVLALGPSGTLVVAGGISNSGSSANGAYRLSTANGHLTLWATMALATHDAAAAVLGGKALIFGGGAQVPSSVSQELNPAGASQRLGSLPEARADAGAVTIGGTAYIAGGFNGTTLDAEVLATTDGSAYKPVAALPVPVRYPALAALDGRVYVFGGQSAAGQPVSDIQVVDPLAGTVRVIGHLPVPLAGAVAADVGGTVYIAGGVTERGGAAVTSGEVFAFDKAAGLARRAGSLLVPVAYAGAGVTGGRLYIVGGETGPSAPTADVQFVRPDRALGVAGSPGAGSPYYGDRLLIADRGNNRILLLDDTGKVTWSYPGPGMPAPPGGFYFPDDAFFIHKGTAVISNQEDNQTIVEIAYPSGRLLWSYGHAKVPGSAPGYLNTPDDAFVLGDGHLAVADPGNCRVLVIDPASKVVLQQIGTVGSCTHNPPTGLGSPNGDTPLANGDLLISEINGSWVDEYTTTGKFVWAVQLPIGYPSDPQQIGPDRYLVADYVHPGGIVEFNRAGQILYRLQPPSGTGELDHPSLVELLPSGVFMVNDDYNHRMAAFDPATGALVWQYGVDGVPGSAPGYLNTPDGFDLLTPGGSTPTHPTTG